MNKEELEAKLADYEQSLRQAQEQLGLQRQAAQEQEALCHRLTGAIVCCREFLALSPAEEAQAELEGG